MLTHCFNKELPAVVVWEETEISRGIMLHELLLALLGYTGDLIIDERENQKSLGIQLSPEAPSSDECTFKLAPDISFLQSSERYSIHYLISTHAANISKVAIFIEVLAFP